MSGSQPAGADGTAVLIGETNTATNPTNVTASAGDGIQGFTSSSENSGLYGNDTSPGGGNGVYATSTNGTGVVGNFRRR